MNVEKLQKMNELARELKSHGLVQSMDDAYLQADSMINNGAYVQIKNLMDDRNAITSSIVDERKASNQVIELHEKLTMQNSKIEQMNSVVMKMQEVMNDLISEVVRLKEHKSITTGVSTVIRPGTTTFAEEAPSADMASSPADNIRISSLIPAYSAEIEVQRAQSHIEAPKMSELRIPQESAASQAAQPAQRRGMYGEKQDDTNHPRQGSYTPMDVSIEKFFNVNKR